MWLLNLPTGVVLVLLSPLLPESARFLQQMGRTEEARAMLARFGVTDNAFADADGGRPDLPPQTHQPSASAVLPAGFGLTAALTMAALAWSLVNFGVLLWLPSALVGQGQSVAAASALIARSTLIAAPVILVSTWLYSRWSTRGCLIVMLAVTVVGLAGLALRFYIHTGPGSVSFDIVIIIIGSSGVIAVLLPYAAENYMVRVRARATGWVAGCTKVGGLLAQALSVLGLAPPIAVAAVATAIPGLIALVLVARYGQETRLRDLRELEPTPTPTPALT
jgi:putative MFS transporter